MLLLKEKQADSILFHYIDFGCPEQKKYCLTYDIDSTNVATHLEAQWGELVKGCI